MKIPSIPAVVLAIVFVPPALLMAWVVTWLRQQRGEVQPASWLTGAVIAAVVYQVMAVAYLFFLRRMIEGEMGRRLREKGLDPVAFYQLAGVCIFFTPACIGLGLSFAGLPLSQMYAATAFSILGILGWIWWSRPRRTVR